MNRILILLFALLTGVSYARADFDRPDFAYPATVIDDATSVLHHATGPQRIKAIMQIVEAKSIISPDSLAAMPAFISNAASTEKDVCIRGILTLYEADVLNRYYNRVQFKVDRLDAPDSPRQADISEWTGNQFRARISELCDSAIIILRPSLGNRLDDFADIITCKKESKPFFTTLGDFVYAQADKLCRGNNDKYRNAALTAALPGTPSWAWWLCNNGTSSREILDNYYKYPDGITGGYLLLKAFTNPDSSLDRYTDAKKIPETVDIIHKYMKSNQGSMFDEYLSSLVAKFTVPWLDYNFPAHAATGKPVEVVMTHGYTGSITIDVYKINNVWASTGSRTASKVYTSDIECDKSSPYANDTLHIDLPIGNYELRAYADGTKDNLYRYYTCNLTVTPWLPLVTSQNGNSNRNITALVDFTTGMPATGVKTAYVAPEKSQATTTGTTGKDGFVDFELPGSDRYCHYYSKYTDSDGNTVYFDNLRTNGNAVKPSRTITTGAIFIDRPAYHPGDTVKWSMVAVEKSPANLTSQLAAEREFSIQIFDANYECFDTVKVTTDIYGRAFGYTVMPADRLTGRYLVQAFGNNGSFASSSFMVSDFRPPVIKVDSLAVKRSGNTFEITGLAATYAGVPVNGAKIDINVHTRPIYLWRSNSFDPVDQSYTATTGSDGAFTVSIPADTLPDGMYICNVTATDAAANTATASASFRTGKQYAIYTTLNNNAGFNTDSIIKAPVYACGNNDSRISLDAVWRLVGPDDSNYSGKCDITPAGAEFDWRDIPAGIYSLEIFTSDSTLSDTCTTYNLSLYSVKKNSLPAHALLLLPQKTFEYSKGQTISVTAGRGTDGYIYATGFYPDGTPIKTARKVKAGFESIEIPIIDGEAPDIRIFAVKDGVVESHEIEFVKYDNTRKLQLKGESWRNNVVPGTPERWTLRLTDGNGTPVSATMTATMYNHALDALTGFNWPDNLTRMFAAPRPYANVSFDFESAYNNYRRLQGNYDYKMLPISMPQFIYNSSYIYDMGVPVRYNMLMARSANAMTATTGYEAAAAEAETVATAYGVSSKQSMADRTDAEESIAEDSAGSDAPKQDNFDYRTSETLQAFWRPDINIGADGTATISFDVPDAIGAWNFRATAWTLDCRAADMSAILTASKPVMVQPAMPRFLRRGDKARVLATVYNNTDSILVVSTLVEIFDPANNSTISSATAVDTIAAKGQAIVPADVNAIYDLSSIGYRVRSTANGFTDGEQDIVPLLDASTTAIDSRIFYLTGNDSIFTAEIPAASDNSGTVALQYCQNPVWDIVKTLPGLYVSTPVNSTEAAASAYAAFTSRGLYRTFPEIRKALDLWQNSPEDSALVSRLYKNEDIKLALLSRTPFVGSANANTEQMERLALTFDAGIIERTANTAVSRLASLQNADGGFAWGDWARGSSEWATENVLTTLGRLNRLGYYPSNDGRLDRIIDRAFGYIESQITDEHAAHTYAYLYSLYPGRKPGNIKVQALIDKAVQQDVAGWKKYPAIQKAHTALMLYNLGNTAVASEIMRSVAQFAVSDSRQGTSFPSVDNVNAYAELLEAFATIDPGSPIIDGMRQWLVLRTQVTSDLGSWDPLTLAAAFIATGNRWTSLPYTGTANVTVDGSALDITQTEALTGSYSLRLPSATAPRTVTFARPAGAAVSYGSIVSVSSRPLDKINAASSRYLSIEKRCLVQRDGKWVETESFTLGERVQVQLIIKADRDMQYITIRDDRPASFSPVDQMPGWVYSGNLGAYRENSDTHTSLFVDYLPKGTYYLTYEMTAALAGTFASGSATIQSQYAPEFTARSSAGHISVSGSTTPR